MTDRLSPGTRVRIAAVRGIPEQTGVVLDTPGILPARTPVHVDGNGPRVVTLVLNENLTPESAA